MVEQIFLSPQVKGSVFINNKLAYTKPELVSNAPLMILGALPHGHRWPQTSHNSAATAKFTAPNPKEVDNCAKPL